MVKAFAQEPAEEAKFEKRSEAVFEQTIQANRQRAFYVPLISFVPMLAQAGVLLFGATMVQNGTLSDRQVRLLQPLPRHARPAVALARHVDRAGAARDRLRRAHLPGDRRAGGRRDRPDAIELPPGPGDVRFEDVSFEYLAGRPVLRDIELDVAAGRTIALIGHTGSGKTTLTSLVPRFYDVTAGRVTIDGPTCAT